jgi:hypothetical protein
MFRKHKPALAGGRRFACPMCGLATKDPVAARLGFCDRCQEFTGMCGAGRKVVCPDATTRTTWHTPCTQPGVAAWQIGLDAGEQVALLCATHDAQVRGVPLPWITLAVPLEPEKKGWPAVAADRPAAQLG